MPRVIADVRPVADYLRRMAPTQTHENRHNFEAAIFLLEGIEMPLDPTFEFDGEQLPNYVHIAIPIKRAGEYHGDAMVTVQWRDDGVNLEASAYFKEFEVPEPS